MLVIVFCFFLKQKYQQDQQDIYSYATSYLFIQNTCNRANNCLFYFKLHRLLFSLFLFFAITTVVVFFVGLFGVWVDVPFMLFSHIIMLLWWFTKFTLVFLFFYYFYCFFIVFIEDSGKEIRHTAYI